MSNLFNGLCEELGMDPNAAAQFPNEVVKQAFFERLASHGIVPRSEQQEQAMLMTSDQLEAKTAQLQAEADPVNQAIAIALGSKQASAPQQMLESNQKTAAMSIVQQLMANPISYGVALANSTR